MNTLTLTKTNTLTLNKLTRPWVLHIHIYTLRTHRKQTHIQTHTQTHRQTDKQALRQTDTRTRTHTSSEFTDACVAGRCLAYAWSYSSSSSGRPGSNIFPLCTRSNSFQHDMDWFLFSFFFLPKWNHAWHDCTSAFWDDKLSQINKVHACMHDIVANIWRSGCSWCQQHIRKELKFINRNFNATEKMYRHQATCSLWMYPCFSRWKDAFISANERKALGPELLCVDSRAGTFLICDQEKKKNLSVHYIRELWNKLRAHVGEAEFPVHLVWFFCQRKCLWLW